MNEDHDLLTRIDENVKDIQRRLTVLNGQVSKNAADIVDLRIRDAKWAAGLVVLVSIAGFFKWLLGG